jgi:hypothetical protein
MMIIAPRGSVQLSGGHILPDETTSTGYSVFNARRIPPQTATAPRIMTPTIKRPLAVSFFLKKALNFLT